MAKLKQTVNCSYCGAKDTVTVTTTQSKYSRSIKVCKCSNCKEQNGIMEVLTRKIN